MVKEIKEWQWTRPLDENPWFLEAVANYVKDKYPEASSVEIYEGENSIARINLNDRRSQNV